MKFDFMVDNFNFIVEFCFCFFGNDKEVEVILVVFYSVIVILGIIGNVLVINVVWKNCYMWIIMNIMLVNIVVFDIFLLIWFFLKCYFDIVDVYFLEEMGKWLCKFVMVSNMVVIMLVVFVYMLSLLVIECYYLFVKLF